jgi:hypothetical protein
LAYAKISPVSIGVMPRNAKAAHGRGGGEGGAGGGCGFGGAVPVGLGLGNSQETYTKRLLLVYSVAQLHFWRFIYAPALRYAGLSGDIRHGANISRPNARF